MRCLAGVLVLLLVACGRSPTAPSETPAPAETPTSAPVEIAITDTITGQPIGTMTAPSLPLRLLVQQPGYVPREAWITTPRVDLFPEAGFDLAFYRQFARDEARGAGLGRLRVWTRTSTAIHLRPGVSAATSSALEAVARQTVPLLTGHRVSVQAWSVTDTHDESVVVIELVSEPDGTACGRGELGGRRIWLNAAARCRWRGLDVYVPLLAHELGHVLGFSHVTRPDTVMHPERIRESGPSAIEQHHAALAYARQPGNADIDVDPAPSQRVEAPLLVVD